MVKLRYTLGLLALTALISANAVAYGGGTGSSGGSSSSGGGTPSGSAGGDLGGTYPNPTVLSLTHATSGNTITIAGHSVALGASQNLACADLTGVAASCGTDATNAANITSGTLPNARIVSLPNANLANSSITIAGHSVSLGGTQAINFTDLTGSLAIAQCPVATTAALGCGEGDGTTLLVASGVFSLNLNQANTWTQPITANSFSPTSSTAPVNGLYLNAANTLGLSANSVVVMTMTSSQMNAKIAMTGNAAGWELLSGATSSTVPVIAPNRADATTGIGAAASGNVDIIIAGVDLVRWTSQGEFFKGTIPAVTGTGTPTITTGSTDESGEVTSGATAISVIITFAASKTNAPFCVVTEQTQLAAFAYTISTTAITITMTATSSAKIDYHCDQH